MAKLLLWKDMTPEEKEELRERLDKASIPRIRKRGARYKSMFHYRYDLTTEDYERLIKKQKGECLICGRKTKLVIDHNHYKKQVRGLLCSRCNRFVGYIEKFSSLIPKIREYLSQM